MSDFENGLRAFKEGDFQEALRLLKSPAEEGNAEAQCILGNIYQLGLSIERDKDEAAKWYLKSANQGYAVASNNLAGMYLAGDFDVVNSKEEAMRWYKISKEQGFQHGPLLQAEIAIENLEELMADEE